MLDFVKLSQLQIGHHKTGRPVLGFGLEAQFAIADPRQSSTRHAVIEALELYHTLFSDQITIYQKDMATRMSPITDDNFIRYYRQIADEKTWEDETFYPHISDAEKIPNFVASSFLDSHKDSIYGSFQAQASLDWFADNPVAWISLVLDWCNKLKPVNGIVGIAPKASNGMLNMYFREYWPFLSRFPGMDFYRPFQIANRRKLSLGSVNWLTILDDSLIAELGGPDALITALGEGITIHKWDGGILIQAGEMPELGDVNQGNWPLAYCQVNDATKALRFEEYANTPVDLIRVPKPLDAYEETLKWVRRFDGRI